MTVAGRRWRFTRTRRFTRRVGRHYRTLATDPEVRSAAKSLAVLGGLWLVAKRVPYLQYRAIKIWRRMSKPGTPGRHVLGRMVMGVREARKMTRLGSGWAPGDRAVQRLRIAKSYGFKTWKAYQAARVR